MHRHHSRYPPLSEAVRLSPTFDPHRLARELAEVTGHPWQPQRIRTHGGGVGAASTLDWRVLPLRSPGGDSDRTDPGGPGSTDFASTAWLHQLPYLRTILEDIPAPLNAVRLMALGPGAASHAHHDPKYALHRGMVRLHIPLITNPGAVLLLDGVEHRWQPGQLWYGDFSRQHLVRNTGHTTRVHTVIDTLLTHELTTWFPPDWRTALHESDILVNRASPPPATGTIPLPYTLTLPHGFTDFDHDQPLRDPLQPGQITSGKDGQCLLAAGDRTFTLTPVGNGEYRFAGWSEQRTLQPTDCGVLLRARHGRALHERHIAATPHP